MTKQEAENLYSQHCLNCKTCKTMDANPNDTVRLCNTRLIL